MKIAIITSGFFPVIDGVTVTLFNRLKALSDRHDQVLVFCPDYSGLESVYPDWREYVGEILPGVRLINLPSVAFMDLDFERNISRKAYKFLLRKLEKFQPDLIHVDEPDRHFLSLLKYPGVDFARRANIPCVGFFHTNFVEYIDDYFKLPPPILTLFKSTSNRLIARNYNAYDITLTASAETQKKLTQMGIRNVINADLLGVDMSKFDAALRDSQFFAQSYAQPDLDRKLKLVFLGRLTPDKGWNFTLDAFSKLARISNLENIAIVIAGDGPLRDRIATHFQELGLSAALLGRIPPDNVPALLSNCDIHITTSEKETKGLTVLEAFAAGIPVIAPRAGGVIDSIQNGENGFLFNPGNQHDFISKLEYLTRNSDLRQTMGNNAKAYIFDYTWEKATERLIEIWQRQIKRKKILHR